jgi:uncharacterized coiled-coil protein SlyX
MAGTAAAGVAESGPLTPALSPKRCLGEREVGGLALPETGNPNPGSCGLYTRSAQGWWCFWTSRRLGGWNRGGGNGGKRPPHPGPLPQAVLGGEGDQRQALPEPRTSNLESRIPNLESRISNLESRISNLESRISNLESRISNLESRISNLESRISNLESRISNLESRISNLESRISNLEPRISNLEPRISNLESRIPNPGSYRL